MEATSFRTVLSDGFSIIRFRAGGELDSIGWPVRLLNREIYVGAHESVRLTFYLISNCYEIVNVMDK